jgi:two-component system chemotaxis response regulator CheB
VHIPTRVLIVDDSAVVRRLLAGLIGDESDLEVCGSAANGQEALDQLDSAAPDVVLLDMEMPVLDGLQTLKGIRRLHPKLPVLMFSHLTERGAPATIDALLAGATDYVAKPSSLNDPSQGANASDVRERLLGKLRMCVPTTLKMSPATPASSRATRHPPAILMAASTGGPSALAAVLSQLPEGFPVPIVVVQHMPPEFTRFLAYRLNQQCSLTVAEVDEREPLMPGRVFVASGGAHLRVESSANGLTVLPDHSDPVNSCRPSADVLMSSAAAAVPGCTAVVLSGMGCDGLAGCRAVAAGGGRVLVQDQHSSVVWGMPGSVAGAGIADAIQTPAQIGRELAKLAESAT